MIHTLRAFRYRNYRLFFTGQSISVVGTWIQLIAMSWLIYRLTGSAWLLGVTGFAGQIAVLLLAPFGGLWSDYFDRRKLLLWTQALAIVPAAALAVLAYADAVEPWHVIAMAAALGVIMAIDTPVRQSFTLEMVPSRQDLPSAIAFNGLMQNAGRMIGPTIAGVLIAVSSEAFCFVVNAASKVAVVAALAMMAIPAQPKVAPTARLWASLSQGAFYAWNLVPVRMLLAIVALVSFMATPYQTLMPIFAAEVFEGGADTLGYLIGGAGLGGMLGMFFLAAREDVRGLLRWVAAGAMLAGAALFVFARSTDFALSLVMITLLGVGIIITAMGVSTIIQTIVEDGMRGRVIGFFAVAFIGMHPLGSLAAGALASWIGATHTLALGGACCVVGGLWLWRSLPALRTHIRPIYVRLGIIND
ncbi:MAG: MFS transporter [Betaproteobacteria bacterium]|nr:MFS transporter [Betaproteobacteria bacterium]